MPTETNRKRSVRRIYAPGTKKDDKDKTYIPLKITDEITFMDEKAPHQEWVLSFKNDPSSTRSVTNAYVGKDIDGKDLPKDQQLEVERIETLETAEDRGNHQEAIWAFLGNKENPPVHLETYTTKIYLSDEKGNITDKDTWIEVQRIRSIEFADPKDKPKGQEYVWRLKNPDEEDEKDDYTDVGEKFAVTKWDFTDINPPYRIDPFQTIVDCSFGKSMMVLYDGNKVAAFKMTDLEKTSPKIGKPTYQKKLSMSSWGSGQKVFTQCTPVKGVSTIFSAFSFDITKSAEKINSSTSMVFNTSDFKFSTRTGVVTESIPLQVVGSGGVVYTPCDVFAVSVNKQGSATVRRSQPPTGWSDGSSEPMWITPEGDYICDASHAKTIQYNGVNDDDFWNWINSDDGPRHGWDAYFGGPIPVAKQYYAGFTKGGTKFYERAFAEATSPNWDAGSNLDYPIPSETPGKTKVTTIKKYNAAISERNYPLHSHQVNHKVLGENGSLTNTGFMYVETVVDSIDNGGIQRLVRIDEYMVEDDRTDVSFGSKTATFDMASGTGPVAVPESSLERPTWIYKVHTEGYGPGMDGVWRSTSGDSYNTRPEWYAWQAGWGDGQGNGETYWLRDGDINFTAPDGISYSASTTGRWGQSGFNYNSHFVSADYLTVWAFPHAYKDKPYFYIQHLDIPTWTTTCKNYTPFSKDPIETADIPLQGWFNLSNGVVIMQGMFCGNTPEDRRDHHIWCNGVDISSQLQKALGLSDLKSVNAIFLDIPIGTIKLFK